MRIRRLYTAPLQQHLEHFLDDMPSESVLSTRPDLIDSLLCSLTSLLLSLSLRIPSKDFHPHRVPGWNPSLKAASLECKHRYHIWMNDGRPQNISHPTRRAYKEAKKYFHSGLRLHRKSSAENFLASLDSSITDLQCFFRIIRKHTCSSPAQRLVHQGRLYENDDILDI